MYDKRAKEELVRAGRAHAALVFDADGLAQGWAKYGRLEEQPIVEHNRRSYDANVRRVRIRARAPDPQWG